MITIQLDNLAQVPWVTVSPEHGVSPAIPGTVVEPLLAKAREHRTMFGTCGQLPLLTSLVRELELTRASIGPAGQMFGQAIAAFLQEPGDDQVRQIFRAGLLVTFLVCAATEVEELLLASVHTEAVAAAALEHLLATDEWMRDPAGERAMPDYLRPSDPPSAIHDPTGHVGTVHVVDSGEPPT